LREALARVSLDAQWSERVTPLALSASRSSTHDCAAPSADDVSVPRPPRWWPAVAALRHQSRTLQREPRAAGGLLAPSHSRACRGRRRRRASHRLRTQAELMHMCSCFFSACKRSWLALRAPGPRSMTSCLRCPDKVSSGCIQRRHRFYMVRYLDTSFIDFTTYISTVLAALGLGRVL